MKLDSTIKPKYRKVRKVLPCLDGHYYMSVEDNEKERCKRCSLRGSSWCIFTRCVACGKGWSKSYIWKEIMSDIIVTTTGGMKPVSPMNGEKYTLVEMQHYVGGNIECIVLGAKMLIIDEEGKLKRKPVNRIATGWFLQAGNHDYIVGDAMLIDRTHIE